MLCRLSRLTGKALTGRPVMLCTVLHHSASPLRHIVDLACYYRDGPDHCLRMAIDDDRRQRVENRRG